ncbi:unnamed protein product [Mucor hiemalis]
MSFRTNERGKLLDSMRREKSLQVVFKKNSAMISSKPSSCIAPPTEITTFFKPDKLKRQADSFNMPTPVKKRARPEDVKTTFQPESDSDEDLQPQSRPQPQLKKPKNIFAKKNKTLSIKKSENGAFFEVDDTDDFKNSQVLKKPKKKQEFKSTEVLQQEREKEQLLSSLKRAQKKHENEADKKKCPFCGEVLYPLTPAIANALNVIKKKEEAHKKSELKQLEKENATSIFSSSTSMIRKRQVPLSEKDYFCRLHNIELIIKPDGESEGYPISIDFDGIEKRIHSFDKELKLVIRKQLLSDYRDIAEKAYRDEGITKARSTLSVMTRFHKSLPGYYGPKGAAVILDALNKMYLTSGYLEKNLVSQQLPLEFLQQVLVPEVGFRLILQDIIKERLKKTHSPMSNSKEKAKKIMLESIDYGSALFPTEDAKIDDGYIENPIKFSELDEEEEEDDPFQTA